MRCYYDVIFPNLKSPSTFLYLALHFISPTFYKDMLSFFNDLQTLYDYNLGQSVLFNNQEILIHEKPFPSKSGLQKGLS